MPPHQPSLELNELLKQAGFLRRLARSLVRDEHQAEDLVQQAWMIAIEKPPAKGGDLRGWLSRILRGRVANHWRGEGRQRDRERAVANPESQDPSQPERTLALQQTVLEAVLDLREPYRSVIYERYYKDLPPRRIAQDLGLPLATVESRLQRGRQMLRAALDNACEGDRQNWCVALLPLIHSSTRPSAPIVSAIFMGTKTKLAAVLVAALTVAAVVQINGTPESQAVEQVSSVQAIRLPEAPGTEEVAPEARIPNQRREEKVPAAESLSQPAGAAAASELAAKIGGRRVNGRVLDVFGQPVGGITLAYHSDSDSSGVVEPVVSKPTGAFEFENVVGSGQVHAQGENWVTFYSGLAREEWDDAPAVVIVARPMRLHGTVSDTSGRTLPNAMIRVRAPLGFETSLGISLENSVHQGARTLSDESGQYAIRELARVPRGRVQATLTGFEPFAVELADAGEFEQPITLIPVVNSRDGVHGRVVAQNGLPVAGALVSYGMTSAITDELGEFYFAVDATQGDGALTYAGSESYHEIVAAATGFLPVRSRATRTDATGAPAWPDMVVLELGAPALTIRGRVVDPSGRGLEGLQVYVANTTLFARVQGRPQVLESLISGRGNAFDSSVISGPAGEFELTGLADRPYKVTVTNPSTLVNLSKSGIPAGTHDLRLEFDEADVWSEVSGVVRTAFGDPLAGVTLTPALMLQEAQYRGRGVSRTSIDGAAVRTDEEGRFTLKNVPRRAAYLRIARKNVVPIWHYPLPPAGMSQQQDADKLEGVQVSVQLRVRAIVELNDPNRADRFAVLNGEGERLILNVDLGVTNTADETIAVLNGKSQVFSVSESAESLVLYKDGEQVGSSSIYLTPDVLNRIDGE